MKTLCYSILYKFLWKKLLSNLGKRFEINWSARKIMLQWESRQVLILRLSKWGWVVKARSWVNLVEIHNESPDIKLVSGHYPSFDCLAKWGWFVKVGTWVNLISLRHTMECLDIKFVLGYCPSFWPSQQISLSCAG